MAGSEMASEHLAAPAAFQTNDIIAMNGLPDRDGGYPLSVEFGYRFPETDERLMNGRDESSELVEPDLVATHISGDDLRS
jgi:hypothetical protein